MGSIVVIMGSKSDFSFAERIRKFLIEEHIPIECRYEISSAHRTPDALLSKLKRYEESEDNIVYITVAGLSDALSGVVAGYSKYPVIACPPDIEKYGWAKVFSTAMTPKGVPVLLATRPENAALSAARILALSDKSLYKSIERYKLKRRSETIEADKSIKEG
ncbi:AIR carboxylase family protein [Candidatus Bathyarchaeota archaeon]|nr:MAG: AIR carboxylase family protein [Candidatus Bathyarchaeota archaeon]